MIVAVSSALETSLTDNLEAVSSRVLTHFPTRVKVEEEQDVMSFRVVFLGTFS